MVGTDGGVLLDSLGMNSSNSIHLSMDVDVYDGENDVCTILDEEVEMGLESPVSA